MPVKVERPRTVSKSDFEPTSTKLSLRRTPLFRKVGFEKEPVKPVLLAAKQAQKVSAIAAPAKGFGFSTKVQAPVLSTKPVAPHSGFSRPIGGSLAPPKQPVLQPTKQQVPFGKQAGGFVEPKAPVLQPTRKQPGFAMPFAKQLPQAPVFQPTRQEAGFGMPFGKQTGGFVEPKAPAFQPVKQQAGFSMPFGKQTGSIVESGRQQKSFGFPAAPRKVGHACGSW